MDMKLHLDTGKILTIKLVDHHLIREWANLFCSLPLEETEISRLENRSDSFDKKKFDELFDVLVTGVKAYGGPEFIVNDYSDFPSMQKLLNKMHHWCVELVQDKHRNQDYPEYHNDVTTIGKLNSLCHQCETLLPGGTNPLPESCRHIYWDQQVSREYYNNSAMKLTDEWLDLMTTEKYDVYLAKRILGKDYREAYRDNDDPTYNEMQPLGDRIPLAMEVDPLNQWQDLFNLQEFLDYLPVPPTPNNIGRIPIGNMVSQVDNIEDVLYNSKIIRATLNESI